MQLVSRSWDAFSSSNHCIHRSMSISRFGSFINSIKSWCRDESALTRLLNIGSKQHSRASLQSRAEKCNH